MDRRYRETKSQGMKDFYELYMSNSHCPTCNGARLRKESLAVKVGDKNINELTEMSIDKIKIIWIHWNWITKIRWYQNRF